MLSEAEKQWGQALEFPLTWHGKIIAFAGDCLIAEMRAILDAHNIDSQVSSGKKSRNGTYVTYNLSVLFEDRKTMDAVTKKLGEIPGVKMVM